LQGNIGRRREFIVICSPATLTDTVLDASKFEIRSLRGLSVNCPNCSVQMTTMTLDAHLSTPIAIDLCTACQSFWFDKYESLKLSPASVLQLMKLIGEHAEAGSPIVPGTLQCPRCSTHLLPTNDIQRATRFSYWRCSNDHGKFIRFLDFLKEKNFICPMPASQIEELKKSIRTINCSNCGASIDLAASSSCTHCGSAISILDTKRAQQTLAQLRQAAEPRRMDPALPLELERVKRDVERSFGPIESGRDPWGDGSSSDLVQEVFDTVARWLTRR
jgi:hypothetical protein